MKNMTLTLALFIPFFAHSRDTTWFDAGWKQTSPENAGYYRTKTKTDSGWQVTYHFRNGKSQITGFFTDDSLKTNGPQITFNENGLEKLKRVTVDKKRQQEWIARRTCQELPPATGGISL